MMTESVFWVNWSFKTLLIGPISTAVSLSGSWNTLVSLSFTLKQSFTLFFICFFLYFCSFIPSSHNLSVLWPYFVTSPHVAFRRFSLILRFSREVFSYLFFLFFSHPILSVSRLSSTFPSSFFLSVHLVVRLYSSSTFSFFFSCSCICSLVTSLSLFSWFSSLLPPSHPAPSLLIF